MKRSPQFVFLLLLAASVAFCWRPVLATLRLALENDAYTHILLIIPLSVALIYFDWTPPHAASDSSATIGPIMLAAALLLAVVARWGMDGLPADLRLSFSMFALAFWWIASVRFCFGAATLRSFLFPLCFLFWIVPLPAFGLDRVVSFLQYQSAFAARVLFWVARVPVTQDDLVLSIPGLDLEVAPECSSIRSSLFLVITTMVLAHLFLRSPWRKWLLIALSIPLSVAKNGLRIFVIAQLTTRVDPGYMDGNLHHHGGIVFFAAAVVAVVLLLWGLQRSEGRGPQPAQAATH